MMIRFKRLIACGLAFGLFAATAKAEEALPTGYVQIDYIKSTGSQYIDTGVTAASDLSAELDYEPLEQEGDGSFGTVKDDNADWRFAPHRDGCFFDCGKARLGLTSSAAKLQAGTRYTVKVGYDGASASLYSDVCNASGAPLSHLTGSVNGEPRSVNIYLFGVNKEGGKSTLRKMSVYSFKLWKGDKLVRDYVPCRTPWNEVGLYDRAGKKFYGNCGSGAFVAPNDPPPSREVTLPDGYVQLDWIESTGTQHIDTEYVPKRTTQVTAFFKPLARNESWGAFFATQEGNRSNKALALRYYDNTYKINGLFCNASAGEATTSGTYENVEVRAAVRDGAMVINGTVHKISTSADPYQGSLILFGERNEGTIRRRQAMRLYWLTIYEGTEVVHDYVPCRRESDGVRGLYDLKGQEGKEFKPNDGTGVFKGPDSAVYAKLNGDGYDYYTVNGERVTAPETGIEGLPLAFANDAEYQALVAVPERVAQATGVFLEKDVTLTADADWSKYDFDFNFNYDGHTVNLNGHKLTVGKLKGKGTVTDASGTGYQLLSYIESDGKAYIDTGYKPNMNTRVDAKFNVKTIDSSKWGEFFACTSDDTDSRCLKNSGLPATCADLFRCRWEGNNTSICGAFHNQSKTFTIAQNNDYTVGLDKKGFTVNDSTQGFGTPYEYTGKLNLYIFGCNCPWMWGNVENKEAGDLYRPVSMKLYFFKITENGVVKRDFMPARRLSDGKFGLFDLAQTGEAFYDNANQGGGAFSASEAVGVGMRHFGAAGGELHVKVANGEVENTDVALTGSLKLVKEGAGTFVAAKTGQTYAGGTEVAGGVLTMPQAVLSNKYVRDSQAENLATSQYLGAQGTEITVDSGAEFRTSGNFKLYCYHIILNGGKMNNALKDNSNAPQADVPDVGGIGWLSLTQDSTDVLRCQTLFSGKDDTPVDLGGHKLTIDGATNEKRAFWRKNVVNGTLELAGHSNAKVAFSVSAAITMTDVTLIDGMGLNMGAAMSVSNYTARLAWNNNNTDYTGGSAALNVSGTFRPETDYFYGCTLLNGATLDLSARKAGTAWSTTSSLSSYGSKTVQFAKGATVYVDLGARRDSGDKGKIVSWTAKPEGVTFKVAPTMQGKAAIKVDDKGIYILRGMMIFIR